MIYPDAVYREGHEGYIAVGYETGDNSTGMKGPHNTTLPTTPSLAAIGYASTPTINNPRNPQPVRAAGSYRPLGFKRGRLGPTISGSIILGGGVAAKKFLQAAPRSSSTSVIPSTNRFMCKPVLAIGGGAASSCQASRGYLYAARFAMLSSLRIAGQMEGNVTADYEAMALKIEMDDNPPTALTEEQIITAGGTPYTLNELTFTTDDDDELSPIIDSFALTIADSIRPRGWHAPTDGDFAYAPRQLTAGNETITLELGLADRLPTAPGTLTIVMYNGVETITIAIGGLELGDDSQGGGDVDSPFNFSANLMATQVTIS